MENSALSDATREAATAWFVRVQSDAATLDDWNALAGWLETAPAHAEAFTIVESLSREIEESAGAILAALGPRSAEILPIHRGERRQRAAARREPARRGSISAWGRGAIAAAVVGLSAAVGFAGWKASEGPLETYHTGAGETRAIALADGSHIRLDAASTMSVRLGLFTRRVRLGDGEATFDVAKDARRPFEVAVGDQRVRVIGTEFNIRNYDGLTAVTVRRGIVAVFQGDQPLARLTKGTELKHVVGTTRFTTRRVDPDDAFAWTQGRLICEDLPLSELVPYLNRRYATPIRLSAGLGERRFSGVLELGDEKDVVRRLAAYLSLSMRGSDREISLS